MKAYILENGDIEIAAGGWIILTWRKEKNRIIRRTFAPSLYWQDAVALLEKTKLGK